MRSVASRATLLIACAALTFPSVAEASSRRRPRRGANAVALPGAARSDEAVQRVLAMTPAGGTARLPSGVYRSAIVVDRPMRIIGSASGTTLDGTGLALPVVEVLAGVSDVTIEGLRIVGGDSDGIVARGGNDRLTLSRVAISRCAGDGARIAASEGVVVDRCTIEGSGGDGLDLDGRLAKASRLELRDGRGAGVVLRGEGATLTDCLFEGGPVGVAFAGKGASALRDVFRGTVLPARFDASADTCSFRRNDVRWCRTAAATTVGSIYCVVAENRIDGASGAAVDLLGTWHTVEGNAITDVASDAIVAEGDSFRIADNVIDQPAGSGIVLDGRGCMVEGNVVLEPAGEGLDVAGDGNVVALNECEGAGADAIRVDGAMNRVVGNRATDAAGEGVLLRGDANTLQQNVLQRTAGNGIHIAGGVGNRVEGNSMTACGGAGFLDEGVGTTLDRNRID